MREVNRDGVRWQVSEPAKNGPWSFWTEFETIEWEQYTLDVVDRFVTENSTFIDLGAWTGPVSMWAADRHNARVIAVEPDPVANDYLNLHVAINKFDRITIVDGAIANHTGTTHLAPHEFGWGSTMSRLSDAGREVACWSISDLFDEYKIENVSLVKIDIEGGEALILETVGPFLAERKIPMVVAMHQPWWSRGIDPEWLAGFDLGGIPLNGWHSVLCIPTA